MGTVAGLKPIAVDIEPLTGDEIKAGIAHKIAQAVKESLDRQGTLYQRCFPKFSASWTINLDIDDYGLKKEIHASGVLAATEHDGTDFVPAQDQSMNADGTSLTLTGGVAETPPNLFRRETEQEVPTHIRGTSKETPHGAVLYQPKNKRR